MATRKKKTSEEGSWEVINGPISSEELLDKVIDRVGDNFQKVDTRETALLMEESPEVRERALEISELVKSGKKSPEWAESQEKYIRTGIRNRQSPPKQKEVKKGAKLPNTRGEGVVSDDVSKKSKKPQGKGTEEVKKIDEKGKSDTSEKNVGKSKRATQREKKLEKDKAFSEKNKLEKEKRDFLAKENFFQEILEIAEKCVKRKGWQKVKIEHAIYAAYLAHPESSLCSLTDLSKRFGFHTNSTLSWRYRQDVVKIRDFLIYELARKYTPGVIQNLAQSASSRNPFTGLAQEGLVKLFLQVVEKWSEKTEVEHSGSVDHDIFTMDLPPSQFVKKEKLPKKKGEDDEDPEE